MKRLIISILLSLVLSVIFHPLYLSEKLLKAEPFSFENLLNGINYKILFTVCVLSFLLMYKFIHYVAKFKLLEKHSRIDIVFVCAFFIVLFIPMLHLDNSEKSIRENRMLAKYTPLFSEQGINNDYGKNVEAWFNDRFFGRRKAIRQHNKLEAFLSPSKGNVSSYRGKENFLFSKKYNSLKRVTHADLFSPEELDIIVKNLYGLYDWGDKHNTQIYLELHPDKESVYPEMLPDYLKYKQNPISRRQQVLAELSKHPRFKIVSPADALLQGKKQALVFCKTGTHATSFGNYIMYQNLMQNLQKDFLDIDIISPDEIDKTQTKDCDLDILGLVGLSRKDYGFTDTLDTLYEIKRKVDFSCKQWMTESEDRITECKNPTKKLKLFVISDSFLNGYRHYFAYHFGEMFAVFTGGGLTFDLNVFADVIEKMKPDIIIISTTERFYLRLLNLNMEDIN